MIDGFQLRALATRLQIPLIYGVDAVHGHNNVVGATCSRTTSASAPRATRRWSKQDGRGRPRPRCARPARRGRSRRACASRATSAGAARTSRFGEDPALVEPMETVINGLQGDGGPVEEHAACWRPRSTSSATAARRTAPRPPAATRSTRASRPSPGSSWTTLHLAPFKAAVEQHGVGSVMPSYSSVDDRRHGRRADEDARQRRHDHRLC